MKQTDIENSFCITDTDRPNGKVVWATLPAMKALYDLAWVLEEALGAQKTFMTNQHQGLLKELHEGTRLALRGESRTDQVVFSEQYPYVTGVVGFDMEWPTLLRVRESLRLTMKHHGQNLLPRYEAYLQLFEYAVNEAAKLHFSAESA